MAELQSSLFTQSKISETLLLITIPFLTQDLGPGEISQRLISLLEAEVGITGLDFKYIYAYVILLTYVLRKMGETKTSCKQFLNSYLSLTDELRTQLSPNTCNQILGTQQRPHLRQLQNFISNS